MVPSTPHEEEIKARTLESKARAIAGLMATKGFTKQSIIEAVDRGDLSLLSVI